MKALQNLLNMKALKNMFNRVNMSHIRPPLNEDFIVKLKTG